MKTNVSSNFRHYSQYGSLYGKKPIQSNNYIYYHKNYEKRIIKNQHNQNPIKVSNIQEIKNQNSKIISNDYKGNNIIPTNNNLNINDIICPECGECVFINIKDYKITLYGCKNNHKTENLLLNEFLEAQKKGLSNIKCDICLNKNKNNTENNEFYRCLNCPMNLCPECKLTHHKRHNIVNHELKYYICKKHNYSYRSFCKTCQKNLCFMCQREHNEHDDIISFKDLYEKKVYIKNEIEEMKLKIETFKQIIYNIKSILDFTISNMERYYKINKNIFNNCQKDYQNYEILSNLYKIKENNKIEDIDNLINTKDINKQFPLIYDIYKKMSNKEDNSQKNVYFKSSSRQEKINEINKTKESLAIEAKTKVLNIPNIPQISQMENSQSNIVKNTFLNSSINRKEKKNKQNQQTPKLIIKKTNESVKINDKEGKISKYIE